MIYVEFRAADFYRQGDRFPDGYKFFSRLNLKDCWVYIPEEHKTEHHNKVRYVLLNKVCQKIMEPFLRRQAHDEYLFSPATEHEIRLAEKRERRIAKGLPPYERTAEPKRKPGKRYNPNSYRTSLQRAIERFNGKEKNKATEEGREPVLIPKWFPNQLRHQFGTTVRENEGLEAAQVALGHSSVKTTEIYAKEHPRLPFGNSQKSYQKAFGLLKRQEKENRFTRGLPSYRRFFRPFRRCIPAPSSIPTGRIRRPDSPRR